MRFTPGIIGRDVPDLQVLATSASPSHAGEVLRPWAVLTSSSAPDSMLGMNCALSISASSLLYIRTLGF
jgi:hypothetical protein